MSVAPPPRLVVDARPIEHPTARQRGIGRYTIGLINGLAAIGADVLALVARPADVALVAAQLPGVRVEVHHPGVFDGEWAGAWFIATGLFLHPLSADPIPSYVTRAGVPVAGVIYDVIPYRFPERYQVTEPARRQAQLRAPLTRTCDAFVAISAFSRQTAIEELGLDGRLVAVIGAGVSSDFRPGDPLHGVLDRFADGRTGGSVVAVTGKDPHKNNERLIEAWSLVSPDVRSRYRLMVVAAIDESTRELWSSWAAAAGCADSVTLTGAVTDAELVALLQRADLSVMASLEEGFGLPVAEAAACGCPTICSNVSSLPEVLDEPLACFDPLDSAAIAQMIERALDDGDLRRSLIDAAAVSAARWRWPAVAARLVEFLTASTDRLDGRRGAPIRTTRLTAVADPVAQSAAADVAEEISARADLRWIDPPNEPAALGVLLPVHDLDEIIVLVDLDRPDGAARRLATRHATHVRLVSPAGRETDPAELQEIVRWARSVIVADEETRAAVAAVIGEGTPVLVLADAASATERQSVDQSSNGPTTASALVDWVVSGCRGGR